jgi:carbonic anhydrase
MVTLRKTVVGSVALAALLLGAVLATASSTPPMVSLPDALAAIVSGNQFFVRGSLGNLVAHSNHMTRQELATGQHPYAIIVSCSDSRVPPEIVFDKGLGEIFVVRVAGAVTAAVAFSEVGGLHHRYTRVA